MGTGVSVIIWSVAIVSVAIVAGLFMFLLYSHQQNLFEFCQAVLENRDALEALAIERCR